MIFAQPTFKRLWFSNEFALGGGTGGKALVMREVQPSSSGGGGPGTKAGSQRLLALGHGVSIEVRCMVCFFMRGTEFS